LIIPKINKIVNDIKIIDKDSFITSCIKKLSPIFFDSINKKAREIFQTKKGVGGEEDLRIECNILIRTILECTQPETEFDFQNEYTVINGRIDSLYKNIVFEYKAPGSLKNNNCSTKNRESIKEIEKYIKDLSQKEHRPLEKYFGILFDGLKIINVKFIKGELHYSDPLTFCKHEAATILSQLFTLTYSRAYTAENLIKDFGPSSDIAKELIKHLYKTIYDTSNSKIQVLYRQWEMSFSQASKYSSGKKNLVDLTKLYFEIPPKELNTSKFLFCIHTYLAIIMKSIATDIISIYTGRARFLSHIINTSKENFRLEITDLEKGKVFRNCYIANFLEADYFSWYLEDFSEGLSRALKDFYFRLHKYEPSSLQIEANVTKDLLKTLYEKMIPRDIRHALGEYYTRDWLAEYVLDSAHYNGNIKQKLIDPACGSGTFLILAINRLKNRLLKRNISNCLPYFLTNIVGLDLNPLAIIAARTNFLIAISNFLEEVERVGELINLPIYLCDTLLRPDVIGKFDYVVGNPPWINWEHLPNEYRVSLNHLWKKYGLFTLKSGMNAMLGGGKKDISALYTYNVIDNFLKSNGKLSFVITQTLLKNRESAEGFRSFKLPDSTPLCVEKVDDMVSLKPFDAANRTAVITITKNKKTTYPVAYNVWNKKKKVSLTDEYTLNDVLQNYVDIKKLYAEPIEESNICSPWLHAPKNLIKLAKYFIGSASYKAQAGANSGGANGIYWINIKRTLKNGLLQVENLNTIGETRIQAYEGKIEPGFLYPLLRGRNVSMWKSDPQYYFLMVQDPETRCGYAIDYLKEKAICTYNYLLNFKKILTQRAAYKRYFRNNAPFYSMFNINNGTFSPFKVVWKEQASELKCAVLSPVDDKYLGKRCVIPDHKLMMVPLQREDEAHYLCGFLNCFIPKLIVKSYTTETSISVHVLNYVSIPKYDPKNSFHGFLSKSSFNFHKNPSSFDKVNYNIEVGSYLKIDKNIIIEALHFINS